MDVVLSDNTKRFLCRSGFALLCVLPTLLCLKSVFFPPGCSGWQAKLQQQFGVINQIDSVQTFSPQRTDFSGIRFGADRFATRLTVDEGSLQVQTDMTRLHLNRARGSVQAFWETIQQIVETSSWSGKSNRPLTIQIDELTLFESSPIERVATQSTTPAKESVTTATWRNMTLVISGQGRALELQFSPDLKTQLFNPDEPQRVSIKRTLDRGKSRWLIDGTGHRIPAWTLRGLVSYVEPLGARAGLADARLELSEQNGLWTGQMWGRLLDVSLQDVIANRFGALLTGNARIDLERIELLNNRVTVAVGKLVCHDGQVGARLLNRCHEFLGMQVVEPHGEQDIRFNDLRFQFAINESGVSFAPVLSGDLKNATIADTAILQDGNGPVLIPRAGHFQPVSSLFRMLAWTPEQMNANTEVLARHLAMPAIVIDPDLRMERTARQNEAMGESFFK